MVSAPSRSSIPRRSGSTSCIGCEVVDRAGRHLGRVTAVEANPASDLLVLEGGGLVPLRFVVEHGAGRLVVDVPDGLLRVIADVRVDVFTIFPGLLDAVGSESLVGRARRVRPAGSEDPRSALGGHRSTAVGRRRALRRRSGDGARARAGLRCRGGGAAAPAPVPARSGRAAASTRRSSGSWPTGIGPRGGFSLLCGRYEGVDERVADHLVDDELSIGDYVLAGGEAAAFVVVEAVARLVPGVMGNEASAGEESFSDGLLEYPQYTRPAEFRGLAGTRGAPLGRPRPRGPVAPSPGPRPHAGPAARPRRSSRRSERRRGAAPRRARVSLRFPPGLSEEPPRHEPH